MSERRRAYAREQVLPKLGWEGRPADPAAPWPISKAQNEALWNIAGTPEYRDGCPARHATVSVETKQKALFVALKEVTKVS
jgi:hypothetical protein